MIPNYHTHTTFCDGQNTPEEIVLFAIENGLPSIGLSGHGFTPFDRRYCMLNTKGYIEEVSRVKEKYKDKIEVYLGIEEDAYFYVNRSDFDYIIGSCHYFRVNYGYLPIDSSYEYFKKGLEAFDNDVLKLAESYYSYFVSYILTRKPDIVGHFDVITKFDEIDEMRFLNNKEYLEIAEKYMRIASQADVIFEINTGAMARGHRKTPYLGEELLYILKKNNGKVILSSDSHNLDTMNYGFDEMTKLLRDVGFDGVYEISDGKFQKRLI